MQSGDSVEVILAICADREKTAVVVIAHEFDEAGATHLSEYQFEDIRAKENYFANLPQEPGVYRCLARYYYTPPDEWEYMIVKSEQIV
jgi:hypothetical protein